MFKDIAIQTQRINKKEEIKTRTKALMPNINFIQNFLIDFFFKTEKIFIKNYVKIQ